MPPCHAEEFAIRFVALPLLLFTASSHALPPTDRLSFSVGGYASSLGLEGRFDGSAEQAGTRYDFGEGFDLQDRRRTGFVALEWSPAERHQFHLTGYRDGRSRTVSIERELTFDEATFPLAAEVTGAFEIRAIDLGYTWWAYRSERAAWGVGLGLLEYRALVRLAGELRRGGSDEPLAEAEVSVSDRLRAPVASMRARYVLTERLRLRADVSALEIGWDNIDGEIRHAHLALEYFPVEHVGLSLGYSHTEIHAETQRAQLRGELELEFSGVQALARVRF